MNLYVCISPKEFKILNYELNKTYQEKIFLTNNLEFPIVIVIALIINNINNQLL